MTAIMLVAAAFTFTSCQSAILPGTLYTLTEAYENDYLSHDELLNIAYYYDGNHFNEELIGEDFQPIPKTKLSNSLYQSIILTYRNKKYGAENEETLENIGFSDCDYFGKYGTKVAVMISDDSVHDVYWQEEVDGVTFTYPNSNRILIWIQEEKYEKEVY